MSGYERECWVTNVNHSSCKFEFEFGLLVTSWIPFCSCIVFDLDLYSLEGYCSWAGQDFGSWFLRVVVCTFGFWVPSYLVESQCSYSYWCTSVFGFGFDLSFRLEVYLELQFTCMIMCYLAISNYIRNLLYVKYHYYHIKTWSNITNTIICRCKSMMIRHRTKYIPWVTWTHDHYLKDKNMKSDI